MDGKHIHHVMAGLIHAHINTYVYTIVASAGAFSEASIHTHTLAHNDVSCLLCVLLYVHIYTRAVLCISCSCSCIDSLHCDSG